MLPGEGRVRQLALSWELYLAAPSLPEERIDSVLCETVADIFDPAVLGNFSFTELKINST